jgi:hypothetical protein
VSYLVKLDVYEADDRSLEGRVKAAIQEAGGAVRRSRCIPASAGAVEQSVTFVIGERRELPAVVRAVEALRGAAVMAVTEPREIRNLRTV